MLAQVGIGLQFLMQKIKTKISKASIYQFETFFHLDYSSESISSSYSDKDQLFSIAKILKKDSIKSIDITHYNSPPSIIPTKYYDKSIKTKYIETNSKKSSSINDDVSRDRKITVVYSKNRSLSQILDIDDKEINHTNYFTQLYNYLIGKLNNSNGFSFFISLSETSFEIIIFNKNEFVFFNSFGINDENEFLYYTFFVLKNYQGSINSDKIIFLGKHERFIKFYDLASKYSKIEFIEDDINFLISYKSQSFLILNENNIRE